MRTRVRMDASDHRTWHAHVERGICKCHARMRACLDSTLALPPQSPNRCRRLCQVSAGLAMVFGEIFGRLGAPTAAQIAERVALLSYASINMAMMSLMKTLDLLGRERRVVERERAHQCMCMWHAHPPPDALTPVHNVWSQRLFTTAVCRGAWTVRRPRVRSRQDGDGTAA